MKQAGGVQCLMDRFCVPAKFKSLCFHSQRQHRCCGCPHCQLLFLDITHFSSKTKPKRTNLKKMRDLMVQELRRKEYMTSGKQKFRKKLHGNLCKCYSSISKHERSSEEHQDIVSQILMASNSTFSPLTLCLCFLEPDIPFFVHLWVHLCVLIPYGHGKKKKIQEKKVGGKKVVKWRKQTN